MPYASATSSTSWATGPRMDVAAQPIAALVAVGHLAAISKIGGVETGPL